MYVGLDGIQIDVGNRLSVSGCICVFDGPDICSDSPAPEQNLADKKNINKMDQLFSCPILHTSSSLAEAQACHIWNTVC